MQALADSVQCDFTCWDLIYKFDACSTEYHWHKIATAQQRYIGTSASVLGLSSRFGGKFAEMCRSRHMRLHRMCKRPQLTAPGATSCPCSQGNKRRTTHARRCQTSLGRPGSHRGRPVSGAPPPSRKLCRPHNRLYAVCLLAKRLHKRTRTRHSGSTHTAALEAGTSCPNVHMGASAQVPHLHQALRGLHLLQRAVHFQDALSDALPRLTQPHEGAR